MREGSNGKQGGTREELRGAGQRDGGRTEDEEGGTEGNEGGGVGQDHRGTGRRRRSRRELVLRTVPNTECRSVQVFTNGAGTGLCAS